MSKRLVLSLFVLSLMCSAKVLAKEFMYNFKIEKFETVDFNSLNAEEMAKYIPQTEFAQELYASSIQNGVTPQEAHSITLEQVVRLPSNEKENPK